jgi:hypothetical protein
MRATLLALSAATLLGASGCGTDLGLYYLPERTYYDMFEQFQGVSARHVRHVREKRWGMYILSFQVKRPSVREIVEAEIADQPNYYVANLNVHTDAHATFLLVAYLFYLPKVVVEFDVIEVLPASASRFHELRLATDAPD